MSNCEECLQRIFDQAEAVVDAIDTAQSCAGALIYLMNRVAEASPETAGRANGLIRAAERFLQDARDQAHGIARSTMDPPG